VQPRESASAETPGRVVPRDAVIAVPSDPMRNKERTRRRHPLCYSELPLRGLGDAEL